VTWSSLERNYFVVYLGHYVPFLFSSVRYFSLEYLVTQLYNGLKFTYLLVGCTLACTNLQLSICVFSCLLSSVVLALQLFIFWYLDGFQTWVNPGWVPVAEWLWIHFLNTSVSQTVFFNVRGVNWTACNNGRIYITEHKGTFQHSLLKSIRYYPHKSHSNILLQYY